MPRVRCMRGLIIAFAVGMAADFARAETIELVTYYPAPSTPDMHTRSLTVGTPYATAAPIDGQAFIYDSVGIGTTNPLGPLHVVGFNDQLSAVIFEPGQDTGAVGTPDIRMGIGSGFTAGNPPTQRLEVKGNIYANGVPNGTALFIANRADNTFHTGLQLQTTGGLKWTIGLRPGAGGVGTPGTEDLQIFSDVDNATRLFIQQGTGNVGIGTTAPAERLEVQGSVKIVDGTQGVGKVLTSDANGKAIWQVPPTVFRDFRYFNIPGTFSWTVPANITRIMVEVWGAGGGGAKSPVSGGYANGAGGGAYGMDILNVTPGNTYTVIVGAGGAGAVGAGAGGGNGGGSSFGTLSAGGGSGGPAGIGGSGGAGGTSSARFNISGQAGGAWQISGTYAPAGAGGDSPRGGSGAAATQGNGGPGNAPGGGGGGVSQFAAAAGRGGDGGVMIWW